MKNEKMNENEKMNMKKWTSNFYIVRIYRSLHTYIFV